MNLVDRRAIEALDSNGSDRYRKDAGYVYRIQVEIS
jgi:hypothetical protein